VDEWFVRSDGSGAHYLTDNLQSTVALTDGSGTVQTEYMYDAFGTTTVTGASTSSTLAFAGRENDVAGLYYSRARYYDPKQQRFISEDPIGFRGGINVFAYANNNPMRFTDPLGLKASAKFGNSGANGAGAGGAGGGQGGGSGSGSGAGGGRGQGRDGQNNSDENDKQECDPDCYTKCLNRFAYCMAAFSAGPIVVHGAAYAACVATTGPAGILPCIFVQHAGAAGTASAILALGWIVCSLDFDNQVRQCGNCTP
jgi:RHS repeat-associated protein